MVAMGVLYDYFRAEDDAAAVRLMDGLVGGPAGASDGGAAVDAIDLKGIEEIVARARRARDAGEDLYCWSCL
jgi:hypothetical protein